MPTYAVADGTFVLAVAEHSDEWFTYARMLTGGGSCAEDLVQQVLLSIWTSLQRTSLILDKGITAYVKTSIKNEFLRQQRSRVRQLGMPVASDALFRLIDSDRGKDVLGTDLFDLISQLRHELDTSGVSNDKVLKAMILQVLGYNYAETAAILGVTIGNVGHYIASARKVLRRRRFKTTEGEGRAWGLG